MKNNTLYIPTLGQSLDLSSLSIDGIDLEDAFDFCDAYVSQAEWDSGLSLSSEELDILMNNDEVQNIVHEMACEECFC